MNYRALTHTSILAVSLFSLLLARPAVADEIYRQPPKEILDVLNAPATPVVSLSPGRDRMLLVQGTRFPSIAELAEPMLRLAGHRINPLNTGPSRTPRYTGITIKFIPAGHEVAVKLPGGARIGTPTWSPDGRRFVFQRFTEKEVQLWVADGFSGKAQQLRGVALNAAIGETFQWMPDGESILCLTIPKNRGATPVAPKAPPGPVVQQTAGKKATIRTYQDLLQSPHDEALFEHFATAQLAVVNARSGRITAVGQPGIIRTIEPSPDGRFILIVRNVRPWSYLLPSGSFPREVEIWDRAGKLAHKVASIPLANSVPTDGVQPGPRGVHWHPTDPASLVWLEALDRGDPDNKANHRDRLVRLAAPFTAAPKEIVRVAQRVSSISWTENPEIALLRDFSTATRRSRTFVINPEQPEIAPRLIWDLSTQDRYADPGAPITRALPNGRRVLRVEGEAVFLSGSGASPQGDRPFLDRFNLVTKKSERLWQCDEKSYESFLSLVKEDGTQIITRRETPEQPPNYLLRTLPGGAQLALTDFKDPAPQLREITKQLVTYKRADGVQCSFTLYLPPGYQAGTRLPTVVWAYPREFADAAAASQISGSPHRFTSIAGTSHLFFLLCGYAILDGATMPVVGNPRTANDTYIDQIVSSAQAAIDKAVEMGVTDRERVGVGGHSYGAFMTANLLAHSDLFRAGVARSGAYNRTLTPFGFQAERRTIWQAQDTYLKMSPFLAANKINEPILLIHGEADNNSGTFPIQSDRMFQALNGNGGTARFVLLPHESHGYEARESVGHVLHEMIQWFDTHVKNASPRKAPAAAPAVTTTGN